MLVVPSAVTSWALTELEKRQLNPTQLRANVSDKALYISMLTEKVNQCIIQKRRMMKLLAVYLIQLFNLLNLLKIDAVS